MSCIFVFLSEARNLGVKMEIPKKYMAGRLKAEVGRESLKRV